MPNTILISGFPIWMKKGAVPLTVEFKGNSFRTLEAVGMTRILFEILCHIMGKLEEILVVSYDAHSKFEEYVFKCKWFKMNLAGANYTVVQDECGHTRLKTSATSYQRSHWQTSEPFTFPSHVEQ